MTYSYALPAIRRPIHATNAEWVEQWNSTIRFYLPAKILWLGLRKKIKVSMPTAIRFIAAYFTRVEQEVRWAAVDSTHSTAWINHIVPFVCDNLRAHHQWFVYQLALPSKNIHIICSFEHWLFIWSLFVQCSIVRNDIDTRYLGLPPIAIRSWSPSLASSTLRTNFDASNTIPPASTSKQYVRHNWRTVHDDLLPDPYL